MASVNTLSRDAIVLGLLTAVGPGAIDMYLPASRPIRTRSSSA